MNSQIQTKFEHALNALNLSIRNIRNKDVIFLKAIKMDIYFISFLL